MISKELASEVLGFEINTIYTSTGDLPKNGICVVASTTNPVFKGRFRWDAINIYELAHKCKEWAIANNYGILSGFDWNKNPKADVAEINSLDDSMEFIADTEPEAIFKACQWILENQSE